MTLSDRDVSDELFARVRRFYDDDALVELTAVIAWENTSSKFNRALRVVLGLQPNTEPLSPDTIRDWRARRLLILACRPDGRGGYNVVALTD
jgi:hypothetical protein